MKIPLSWLTDFVDTTGLTPEDIAYKLTFGGLEVEDVQYLGLAPADGNIAGLKMQATQHTGLAWHREKIVVAQILEVLPHPNADRLTLLRLDDGTAKEQTVLTGAPNIFQYKGQGPLPTPLKVAYAREGSILYDGHKPGQELMTLKRAKIRGIESYSMVCSAKELGLSEEHDGIILLPADAPVGTPLADYMGDVVFTIKTNPNMARNINVYGIARELAALTGRALKPLPQNVLAEGPSIEGQLKIEIRDSRLNPRFTAALIMGVTVAPSPALVQKRLQLCGVRPINNIVDATNYAMLELGQPLHAFDWDVLQRRQTADGRPVTLITRLPEPGEAIKTLDGTERKLDDFSILVCDTAGALSLGGVMGGAESEVSATTVNVLLEGAAWEFINIRRTVQAQKLPSEAAYRFSRGVHPAMTVRGVTRGIELMRQWGGGTVAHGLVDVYANPAPTVVVEITPAEVERLLGLALSAEDIARLLAPLEFKCEIKEPRLEMRDSISQSLISITVPDHRLDIGAGAIGRADVIEEIARMYGYERIPEIALSDPLPPQRANRALALEEQARDVLADAGLQEVVTYSLTAPERERRLLPPTTPADDRPYVTLINPIVVDRVVMRHTVLSGVLDVLAANRHVRERLAVFEIGPVYLANEDGPLPDEPRRVALALTGPRAPLAWQGADTALMDFFDLKGVVEALMNGLHLTGVTYEPGDHPTYLPGRTARLKLNGAPAGWLGELHPLVREAYDLPVQAVLVAELDLELLLASVNERYAVSAVPEHPPVKEDLALIVSEETPAAAVQAAIGAAGGALLTYVTLFDVYRGPQIGDGKKSLAYNLTYQARDRTLTDAEVAKVRGKIVKKVQEAVGAVLRG